MKAEEELIREPIYQSIIKSFQTTTPGSRVLLRVSNKHS